MTGAFFIIFGLILIGVAVYYWLFGHEKGASEPLTIIDTQQNQVDTNAGVVENYIKGRKVKSQTEFQKVVTENKQAVRDTIKVEGEAVAAALEKEAVPDRHDELRKKEVAETESYLAGQQAVKDEFELRKLLIAESQKRGLPLSVLEKVLEKEELDKLAITYLQNETRVKLEAGFIYQLREYHKIMMLRKELDGLYHEIDTIQNNQQLSEYVRTRQIEEREDDIKVLREDRRARRQRLLQAFDGEEAGGSNPDSEP